MLGTSLLFLTSGLFLGWSLGANDAANVFGTAVGSRMIRFLAAGWICSIFVVLGAVIGGAGAAHGLGQLGAVNTLAGSFTVALSAALTVYWMTRAGLPVSTTQAIVGGIVGWNFFSGSTTDIGALTKIVGTWIACPILGAIFSATLYRATVWVLRTTQPHLLRRDLYTRWGLILAGAFGSYSLGANNIGNVMGVFVTSSPFRDVHLGRLTTITGIEQLFFVGAVAIAVGVFTYSRRVMLTVGQNLMPLNPVAAWVVVVSHSLVLFFIFVESAADIAGRLGLAAYSADSGLQLAGRDRRRIGDCLCAGWWQSAAAGALGHAVQHCVGLGIDASGGGLDQLFVVVRHAECIPGTSFSLTTAVSGLGWARSAHMPASGADQSGREPTGGGGARPRDRIVTPLTRGDGPNLGLQTACNSPKYSK